MLAHPAKLWLINTDLDAANGYGTKMSPRNQSVTLAEPQQHVINPANPSGALDDGIEHRLHVRRRAADDAEHLGRCRLMLQGLAICVLGILNRAFSMAMTAWSAKVLRSAICLSVKGRTSVRRIMIAPMGSPSRSSGAAKNGLNTLRATSPTIREVGSSARRHEHESPWDQELHVPVGDPRLDGSNLAMASRGPPKMNCH